MRWKHACIAVLCSAAFGSSVRAQAPTGVTLPEPKLTRQSVFSIPFRVTASKLGQEPVEVQLQVSTDMGKSWQLDSRVLPAQGSFNFRGQHDGEYWFVIRTVDAQGQLHPSGPTPPGMRVIIDTTPPALDLFADRGPNNEVRAKWQATDANLDPNSFKLEYQTGPNQPWQPISVEPSRNPQPNVRAGATTFWPQPNAQGIIVRAQVLDRAGNPTIAQINVDQQAQPNAADAAQAGQAIQSVRPATTPTFPTTTTPLYPGATTGGMSDRVTAEVPRSDYRSPASTVTIPSDPYAPGNGIISSSQKWSASPSNKTPLVVDNPLVKNASASGASSGTTAMNPGPLNTAQPSMPDRFPVEPRRDNNPFSPAAAERVVSKSASDASTPTGGAANQAATLPVGSSNAARPTVPATIYPTTDMPGRTPSGTSNPPVTNRFIPEERGPQLMPGGNQAAADIPPGEEPRRVNSTKFELAYDLDATTSAGATRVDLYGTRDGGKTWTNNGTAAANSGTVAVRVDGEGTYGFRLAVQKANGTSTQPRNGDLPEVWVVVDTTKPEAKLTSAELGTGTTAGTLFIRWEASDAKLAARPVSLFFAANKGGPWTTIASGLDNSGQYGWKLDRRVPDRVYLRLEVSDEAGNLTAVESADPVSLNPSSPTGRIRGVRPLTDDGAATRWQTWR